MATSIKYGDSLLASLDGGKSATIHCADKVAAKNIKIAFDLKGNVTYNGVSTNVPAGKTATVECAKKKMLYDISISVSEAFNAAAQGRIVSLKDISPESHTLDIKIDHRSQSGFSDVKVIKLGKNLFNSAASQVKEVTYTTKSGTISTKSGYEIRLPAGKYFLNPYKTDTSADCYIYTYVNDKDGNCRSDALHLVGGAQKNDNYVVTQTTTFTFYYDIKEGDVIYIVDAVNSGLDISKSRLTSYQYQMELGETATEYEPYIEPIEYPAAADGTVEGVTSLYPCTTLYADLEDSDIFVKYNAE